MDHASKAFYSSKELSFQTATPLMMVSENYKTTRDPPNSAFKGLLKDMLDEIAEKLGSEEQRLSSVFRRHCIAERLKSKE